MIAHLELMSSVEKMVPGSGTRRPQMKTLKTYAVVVDGATIGTVFQEFQLMQKIRAGSRIADRSWYSVRWRIQPLKNGKATGRSRAAYETRKSAVADLVESAAQQG